jgi:GNAT superfamily N-acetyltransferase
VILTAPQPLASAHRLEAFACGESDLDHWLKQRAWINHTRGASRVFVCTDDAGDVFAYYALAAGAVSHDVAIGNVRRNMPDPVPVLVLGRLAVDRRAQGLRLGAAMLQDAIKRALAVSEQSGVRALLVHALHDEAKRFYEHYGFRASSAQPLTLMLRLAR